MYQSDSGCAGRAHADVSADADPATGLKVYDSGNGGWLLMGGTSLASPLIAAYYAITGLSATTPQWAYASSAVLNDPASGSSGSCAQNILYICNAGVGYDGPTGVGSISGAVVAGAPGIGGPSVGPGTNNTYTQSASSIDATLTGGIYPNGLQTTWAPVLEDEGARVRVYVSATGPGGTASAVSSGAGPVAMAPPINTGAPSVIGSAQVGATLTAGVGSWDPAAETFTYSWQRAYGSGGFQAIPGATRSTYTVAPNDLGDTIRVIVTATNPDGTAAVTSPPTAAIAPAPPAPVAPAPSSATASAPAPQATAPSAKSLPSLSGGGGFGANVTVTRGVFAGAPVTRSVTRVMRCTHSCTAVGAPNARTYKISPADAGAVLRVIESASSASGSTTVWSARSVGPVTSANAGFAVLGSGHAAVRGRGGRALAVAILHGRVLSIHRPRSRGRAPARAWACPVAGVTGGAPPSCMAVITVRGSRTLRLPSTFRGRVRVVVVAARG